MNKNNEILAHIITDHLFDLGSEPGSPAQRIAFKGGTFPDNEKSQGGLCKDSLLRVIRGILSEHNK